jgi:hypothetical protein
MNHTNFLNNMAALDEPMEHDPEVCGNCAHRRVGAELAREMLAAGDVTDAVGRYGDEWIARWERGKFFTLWADAAAKGLDPRAEFAKRGWAM